MNNPMDEGNTLQLERQNRVFVPSGDYPAGTSSMNCLFQGGERQSRCGQERGD